MRLIKDHINIRIFGDDPLRFHQSNCYNSVFKQSGGAIDTVVVVAYKKRLMRA